MNKNLSQSSQSVLESLADAIDQMIHIVETHDYSKKDNLLAVSAMAEHLGNKFGVEKLCLQLVFSSVINGTEGEQAYHTLQGRYGGVKPGEKFEPKPFSFVSAPLLGTWMNAYFYGMDETKKLFRVQFSEDAPIRLVSNVKPPMTTNFFKH